jgi:hypothetical protein
VGEAGDAIRDPGVWMDGQRVQGAAAIAAAGLKSPVAERAAVGVQS